jgi:hypothetical protein
MSHIGALPHLRRFVRSPSRRVQQRSKKVESLYNGVIEGLKYLDNFRHDMSASERNFSECGQPVPLRYSLKYHRRASSGDPNNNKIIKNLKLSSRIQQSPYRESIRVPLEVEKISLPDNLQSIQLLDVLPRSLRNALRTKQAAIDHGILRPASEHITETFRPFHDIHQLSHERALRMRLRAANMLTSIPRNTPNLCFVGLFATLKSDGFSQRLITDARNANLYFAPPPDPGLPSISSLGQMHIPADGRVPFFSGKSDLRDYYHKLQTPSWMWRYCVLPPLDDDSEEVDVMTSVLMGHAWSVFLGMAVHIHIIKPGKFHLQLPASLPPDKCFLVLWLDDIFSICRDALRLNQCMQRYKGLVHEAGFETHKEQEATSAEVTALGMLMDGRSGYVTAAKMPRLVEATRYLLSVPWVSSKQVEVLTGHWVWAALIRRPLLSIFNAVFKFSAAGFRKVRLWPTVKQELQAAVNLAPLFSVRLTIPFSLTTYATDASLFGNGVVRAFRDQCPRAWHTIVSAPWKFEAQITELEAASVLTALRHFCSTHHSCCRLYHLVDNTAVIGAILKGRSSSRQLFLAIRKIAALCLLIELLLYPQYIDSLNNPADPDSRLKSSRSARATSAGQGQ